jgi:hypothetical protein
MAVIFIIRDVRLLGPPTSDNARFASVFCLEISIVTACAVLGIGICFEEGGDELFNYPHGPGCSFGKRVGERLDERRCVTTFEGLL